MKPEGSDHLGGHVARVVGVPRSIEWLPAASRAEGVRVREYTCDCQATYYELCQAGGVRFIRRVRADGTRLVIAESRSDRAPAIDELWLKLIAGAAR